MGCVYDDYLKSARPLHPPISRR